MSVTLLCYLSLYLFGSSQMINAIKFCSFCPAYTPGKTALKIVEKQIVVESNSKQSNLELANFILDRLTILYPMHRFVIIVYNAEYGVHCEERDSNRKIFVQYNVEVTGKFPVKGGKCVLVANALSNQPFTRTTECHGDLEGQSCATKPSEIAKHVDSECHRQLSALGVFAAQFEPGIAHSMPRNAFKHQIIRCDKGQGHQDWHLVIVLQQNYSMIGSLLLSNHTTLVPRKTIIPEHHRIPIGLFIVGMIFVAVLIVLIIIMSFVVLFLFNFHGKLRRLGCSAYFNAFCFLIHNEKDEEELDPKMIDIEQLIYSGPNSRVYFGNFRQTRTDVRVRGVAVKVPSKDAFQIAVIKREMRINALLHHPHIVEYIGFYRDAFQNIRIVSEFMAGGDLHTHLSRRKTKNLTVGHIFNFLTQIADGMEYLMSMQIIHRDLAARNCMLNAECTELKIADFGLSRHFGTEAMYACSSPVRLPLRWIAIECFGKDGEILPYCIFSEKTDVWAFGMVVWECFAHGELPYGTEEVREVLYRLKGQGSSPKMPWRLPCPAQCPQQIYTKLMLKCWEAKPENRPNFTTVKKLLTEIYDAILQEEPDIIARIL